MHPIDNNIPRNIFQELIAEIVKPEDVDLDSIKQHKELNEIFWDENQKMKPEIRKILLENAKAFIDYANMEEKSFNDIILTGSIANYNYTDISDVDVHIVLDFSKISDDVDLVADLFKTKKKLWSKIIPSKIKDHDVELYFQDCKEKHKSTGVYSLMNNEWIRKPINKVVDINSDNIRKKTIEFINKINDLEKLVNSDEFIEEFNKLNEKIKKYRQIGLDTVGEYSTENIVFKLLRNLGYLEMFFELKKNHLTKKLTIKQ